MDEDWIRKLIGEVNAGRLSRRRFIRSMVPLGLTVPLAVRLLPSRPALAQGAGPAFQPTRRGGGGPLRLLYWQAPTILKPHLAVGVKDVTGSRIFYEPLADFDAEGQLAHNNRVLAADIDTIFFMTAVEFGYVSSSLVKEIASFGGDISSMIPGSAIPAVTAALARR